MLDVDDQGVSWCFAVPKFNLPDILEEIFVGIEPRDGVPFGLLDEALVFEQLDNAFAAGKHHLGHVEGFLDKVFCSQLEASDFGFLFRGHHDDGNPLEGFVFAAFLQELETVHDRHEQVQKHQGIAGILFRKFFQGLLRVVGVADRIFLRKDIPENLAVDQFVIYDEDVPFDGPVLSKLFHRESPLWNHRFQGFKEGFGLHGL